MRVAVVGTGYVGLVTGCCLASLGHTVACVDSDRSKVVCLTRGEVPIHEPGLARILDSNLHSGRLSFTDNISMAAEGADIVVIAVGTPQRDADGKADLSNVFACASDIFRAVKGFAIVAVKSTVPVGTGDQLEALAQELRPASDIVIVSNPEFLREGSAISDFMKPDRIIAGLQDDRARPVMVELYGPILASAPLVFTSRRNSELIKYAANAFLAMKVAFINEIADLCEATGANVVDVASDIGLDRRIGSKFLAAGPGFGGSCFPKDTMSLLSSAREVGVRLNLIETTISANVARKGAMAQKIATALGGSPEGKKVAFLGVTYKPNTDDMREAPSLAIIPQLQSGGAKISCYDPAGMRSASMILKHVEFGESAYDAAHGADAVIILTEWKEFRALSFSRLKQIMAKPLLIDLRNMFRREEVTTHGFSYVGLGC